MRKIVLDPWNLKLEGGTKAERDAATAPYV
jgi:hypothetical protein